MGNSSQSRTSAVAAEPSRVPFRSLSGSQRAVRICKIIVCILTFGMVFPHINEFD